MSLKDERKKLISGADSAFRACDYSDGGEVGQMGAAISWRFEKAPRVSCFSSTGQHQEGENGRGVYMQANEARLLLKI